MQTLCYKEEIESSLRTPSYSGFQLLDLHDFPGQGTALVGVLDPFWDSKPYVNPSEYKRFSGPIVPLARLGKRIFTSSQTLTAQIDISHFGPKTLEDVKVKWSLLDTDGNSLKEGILTKDLMPKGDLYKLGFININLSDLAVPAKYNLQISIDNTEACNDWDVWVYPDSIKTQPQQDIKIASTLDDESIEVLNKGGKVLLALQPNLVNTNVELGFSCLFFGTPHGQTDKPLKHLAFYAIQNILPLHSFQPNITATGNGPNQFKMQRQCRWTLSQ